MNAPVSVFDVAICSFDGKSNIYGLIEYRFLWIAITNPNLFHYFARARVQRLIHFKNELKIAFLTYFGRGIAFCRKTILDAISPARKGKHLSFLSDNYLTPFSVFSQQEFIWLQSHLHLYSFLIEINVRLMDRNNEFVFIDPFHLIITLIFLLFFSK